MSKTADKLLEQFRLRCLNEALGVRSVRLEGETIGRAGIDFVMQRPRNIFSAAKTVTALGVGIAVDEGLLTTDTRALDLFPSLADEPGRDVDKLTIRHCLQMTAGKKRVFLKSKPRHTKLDWLKVFLEEDLDHEPGRSFFYNNVTTYLLSRAIEAVSGQTMFDYLKPRLFAPLQIDEVMWMSCPNGHTVGYADLHLLPDDFAKITKLMLDCGRAGDREIVSSGWIDRMHKDVVQSNLFKEEETRQGYGYQCWLGTLPGSYRADGIYGQFGIVSPVHGACVTVTAHNVHTAYRIITAVNQEIFEPLARLEEYCG